jgi:hypothetical protein
VLAKIISGGQTGADIGGLRAARAAGIPTGEVCSSHSGATRTRRRGKRRSMTGPLF